ncbi:NAD(P)-dependent oxidoreductase [Nonomuraea turcica]|uniref:NAD(P)-dependent oxidoreductase n=1 Tax=Nonomuraea sp. G32 TaxID=3067274 RepID=UPI00273CD67C|nr:NAD(P)-dependent oxidoreductase [Nonomuraea sp. G32]MDP4507086.1 DUF1932 domain-containing protein [Nonomuraea sp. G32]
MDDGSQVALLGYGEVGRVLADGLGRQVRLHVYDPAYPPGSAHPNGPALPPGRPRPEGAASSPGRVRLAGSNPDAVRGADLVIAVTTGADSVAACAESCPYVKPGAVYADLSTSAPGDKRRIAELVESAGATAVDGAIMAPIPLRGLATPILASGRDADRFAAFANAHGMEVAPIGGSPGDAAARKLLRSVLVKGLSALVIESRRAAEAAGLGEWFWGHLLETVTDADEQFVMRLLRGAGQHSVRRVHEMHAATRMLAELGVDHTMTAATAATLEQVARSGIPDIGDAP